MYYSCVHHNLIKIFLYPLCIKLIIITILRGAVTIRKINSKVYLRMWILNADSLLLLLFIAGSSVMILESRCSIASSLIIFGSIDWNNINTDSKLIILLLHRNNCLICELQNALQNINLNKRDIWNFFNNNMIKPILL